jgi:sulfate/thiosulfate transport system ATP-binding protein
MSISILAVSKNFGAFSALDDVTLDIAQGELVALLGPSGSGKTTLLRVIAGLERPDRGEVRFLGEDITNQRVQERGVGFVFQHYALFRHMTIFENVAFGLRVRPRGERPAEAEIQSKVKALLELVQLDWLAGRFPHQLSGGQRQRIALARALAIEPRVLLLDEPFGALDAQVRKELRRWLRRLHDEIQLTSVFVTHDQEEALEVADRVVVFNHGRVEQVGTPAEVYDRPASPFVYKFIGHVNELKSDQGIAYVRPHEIDIVPRAMAGSIEAVLEHVVRLGPRVRLELTGRADHEALEVELAAAAFAALGVAPGDTVHVAPRRGQIFDATPATRAA